MDHHMTYQPDVERGDWWVHRRTIGIPGVDSDFVGVETVPPALLRGTDSATNTPVATGTSLGTATGTTTSGSPVVTSTISTLQVGMAVTGTNIPNAYAVTSTSDAIDTNQITVGTVTNSSGYTGGFQTGMILIVGSVTAPSAAVSGHTTVSALITGVSGNVITLDRKINIASNTRVGAFPVVISKTTTTFTMSIAASGNGTQTLTFWYINSCSFNIALVYVPRTINVQHARLSFVAGSATTATIQPMIQDTQDARIMIFGPTTETDQYVTPLTPYAISRNLISNGEARDRWSSATNTTDIDNSSLFVSPQATIQPMTGTGTLTSVSTTTSTSLSSNSNQAVLQVASTTGITTGMTVTCPTVVGIPINTTVSSIGTGTVTLSNNLTATIGTSVALNFGTLTSVTNDAGYTNSAVAGGYITGTGIPQGVSTVSTTVSASTTVTVADASSFQIGMAVISHNAIASTTLITSISGNTLTLSAAVSVSAGAGLYGYVRVNSSTSPGPNATIVMTNAPTASGAVTWSVWPHIGFLPSSANPLYLRLPYGTLKRNQVVVGAGIGTGARIAQAYPVTQQTNVWAVTFNSITFTGSPPLPMTHYTFTTTVGSITNGISSTSGILTSSMYLISGGSLVSGGFVSADTRFYGTSALSKPALLSTGAATQATVTPTITIRPNNTVDTRYGISGFSAAWQGVGISSNTPLSNLALPNPNPAFSSPVQLQGGCWYYVGLWTGGTAFSSASVAQVGAPIDWTIGRTPLVNAKQYANKFLSNNPGNWSAGSSPSTPVALSSWNGGFYASGSAAPAIPFKTVNALSVNGVTLGTNDGYSNNTIPYIALYE